MSEKVVYDVLNEEVTSSDTEAGLPNLNKDLSIVESSDSVLS